VPLHHDQHTAPQGRRNKARPDLNLKDIAAKLSISRGYLSQIMNGTRRPSLTLAVKLAPELGVPVERLERELAWYRRKAAKPRPRVVRRRK